MVERFSRRVLGSIVFDLVRHSIDDEPEEAKVAIVSGGGFNTAAIFKDGKWCTKSGKPISRALSSWTEFEGARDG